MKLKGMQELLKIGLIGAGAIGELHLKGYKKEKACKLVAVASRTREHALEASEKFSISNVYVGEEWKQMLKDEDLDAVSICTPNYLHAPMILEAIQNDIHILCEKPIATSEKDLFVIERKLEEKELIFFTAFNKRYVSHIPLLKEVISSQIIGEIISIRHFMSHYGPYRSWKAKSNQQWFYNSEKAGGGVLMDLGVHSIDLFRFLVGEYTGIEGVSFNSSCLGIESEDFCSVLVRLNNSVIGNIIVSWCNYPQEVLELFGTKGTLQLDLYRQPHISINPRKLRKYPSIKKILETQLDFSDLHSKLINEFIDSIIGINNGGPRFYDGKRAVEFVLDSYSFNRKNKINKTSI